MAAFGSVTPQRRLGRHILASRSQRTVWRAWVEESSALEDSDGSDIAMAVGSGRCRLPSMNSQTVMLARCPAICATSPGTPCGTREGGVQTAHSLQMQLVPFVPTSSLHGARWTKKRLHLQGFTSPAVGGCDVQATLPFLRKLEPNAEACEPARPAASLAAAVADADSSISLLFLYFPLAVAESCSLHMPGTTAAFLTLAPLETAARRCYSHLTSSSRLRQQISIRSMPPDGTCILSSHSPANAA